MTACAGVSIDAVVCSQPTKIRVVGETQLETNAVNIRNDV